MSLSLDFSAYEHCELCPRRCGAKRLLGQKGFCGESADMLVARAALHFWEEPPISGKAGSGAIFFTGCPLRCVFCQNHSISQEGFGKPVTTKRLAQIMLELQAQGALNINLVTPLHFTPHIVEALHLAKQKGLSLPIVCNTSGYERPDLVELLLGEIDIWLCDYKYRSSKLALTLSRAANYPEMAEAALTKMLEHLRDAGGRVFAEDGRMTRGIIVRHLVLPGHTDDSKAALTRLWNIGQNDIDISIMNQYTPNDACKKAGGNLSRALSEAEYEKVLDYADELGFEHMWWQQGGTVSESFVPAFDASGVIGPELQ